MTGPGDSRYQRLRIEWQRFKSHVIDPSTELPTLAAVLDDVRRLMEERGTLGLAMRNPLDKNLNPTDPMVVKEGQLTASSEAMDSQTLTLVNQLQTLLGNRPPVDPNCPPIPLVSVAPEPNEPLAASGPEYLGSGPHKRSAWQMTIIRGQKIEEAQIKLKDESGESTPPTDANQTPAGTK